jgi:endoribonuclease Dicer
MAMVSNKFLGTLAVQLGLHTHLQYFSNALQFQINKYVEECQLASENQKAADFWLDTEDPPKVSASNFASNHRRSNKKI